MSDLRGKHRIVGRLTGAFFEPPPGLADQIVATAGAEGRLILETTGDLASHLGYLASLPLVDVRIAPLGLRNVYARVHPTTE